MLDRLIDLMMNGLHLLQFWTVIYAYEAAVRFRFGVFHSVLEPGMHWKLPFNMDYIHKEHVVPRTHRMTSLAGTTQDGLSIGFDVVVTYRINDIKKATLEVEDVRDSIMDACAGTVGSVLAQASWGEIVTGAATDKLTTACRKRGWKWGVEIQSVQLVGVCTVRNIRLAHNQAEHHDISFGI